MSYWRIRATFTVPHDASTIHPPAPAHPKCHRTLTTDATSRNANVAAPPHFTIFLILGCGIIAER